MKFVTLYSEFNKTLFNAYPRELSVLRDSIERNLNYDVYETAIYKKHFEFIFANLTNLGFEFVFYDTFENSKPIKTIIAKKKTNLTRLELTNIQIILKQYIDDCKSSQARFNFVDIFQNSNFGKFCLYFIDSKLEVFELPNISKIPTNNTTNVCGVVLFRFL